MRILPQALGKSRGRLAEGGLAALLVAWLVLGVGACAGGGNSVEAQNDLGRTQPNSPDAARLATLWEERAQAPADSDFPIGPGDVLEINVPGLEEIQDLAARVSPTGRIPVPLIGAIPVEGMSEKEVTEEIRRRLGESVMYDPPVFVFVREYRSRAVGVIGAVASPGFHSLSSPNETILDVLSQAGGLSEGAAPRLSLFPAPTETQPYPTRGTGRAGFIDAVPGDSLRAQPIVIDLTDPREGGGQVYLSLPIRPGDVIVVHQRGDVLVKGWVHRPGAHAISPDLTLLGAVSAAGGPRFAADRSAIELIREDGRGGKLVHRFDIEKLERGEQLDPLVEAGDVVDISHSTIKVIPWSIWEAIRSLFTLGVQTI